MPKNHTKNRKFAAVNILLIVVDADVDVDVFVSSAAVIYIFIRYLRPADGDKINNMPSV